MNIETTEVKIEFFDDFQINIPNEEYSHHTDGFPKTSRALKSVLAAIVAQTNDAPPMHAIKININTELLHELKQHCSKRRIMTKYNDIPYVNFKPIEKQAVKIDKKAMSKELPF